MPHRTVLAHSGTEPLQKVRQILWIRSRDLQKKTTTKNNPQCISLGVSLKRSKRIFDFEKVWGSLGHLKFEDFYPVIFFWKTHIFMEHPTTFYSRYNWHPEELRKGHWRKVRNCSDRVRHVLWEMRQWQVLGETCLWVTIIDHPLFRT